MSDGDILVLCTDGLTGHVLDERIRDTVLQLPPQPAVHQLIEMAKEDGGTDNISTVVLRVGPPPPAPTVPAVPDSMSVADTLTVKRMPGPAPRQVSLVWMGLGFVIVLALVGGVAAAVLVMGGALLGRGGRTTPTPTTASFASPQIFPTVTPMLVTSPAVIPTATSGAPITPTQTLIPTPTPVPTQPRTPTAPAVTGTHAPVFQPSATVACTGGRVWNGVECVCPQDKPNFLGGQCVGKDEGGGNEPPVPPR